MSVRSLWVIPDADATARRRVVLSSGSTLIVGRDASCDLTLEGNLVSRRHCQIDSSDDGLYVRDLNSKNKTFIRRGVDGRVIEVKERTRLDDEDRIRVATYTLLPAPTASHGVSLVTWPLEPSRVAATPSPVESATSRDTTLSSHHIVRAIETALARADASRSTARLALAMLAGAVDARDGVLLTVARDTVLLRSHLDDDRDAAFSESFVERVLQEGGVVVSQESSASSSSPSKLDDTRGDRTCVVGARLSGADGSAIGAACLDCTRVPSSLNLIALERVLPLASRLIEQDVALDRETRRREAAELRAGDAPRVASDSSSAPDPGARLIGNDPRFRAAIDAAGRAARTSATVLIRGASGTGKDLLARYIHDTSPRGEQPFVAVNCAAIPPDLVESELFGHDRGAFTGAISDRRGAFQQAHGGTLFLDEIGDLSLAAQAKVLRALEAGEIVRVGGSVHLVDVRVVAATHRDLEAMVRENQFREDLYYRLRVIELALPSLAQRRGDILLLAEHFLLHFRAGGREPIDGISAPARRALQTYSWRGNVRELRNVIERAVVLDRDGVLDIDDLPSDVRGDDSAGAGGDSDGAAVSPHVFRKPWKSALDAFARQYFTALLVAHGYRVTEAADAAGITRRALSERIRELGIERKPRVLSKRPDPT